MGRLLVCYRVTEEDLGIIVGHRPSLQYSLKCRRECANHVPREVCLGLKDRKHSIFAVGQTPGVGEGAVCVVAIK